MKLHLHLDPHKTISHSFCNAFAQGCGGAKIVQNYEHCSAWAGYGSPILWHDMIRHIKSGGQFYYGDHPYFGRGKFFRVTKNAFQHDGRGEPDYERLKVFHESVKPWKKNGRNIVICTQTQAYYDRTGNSRWLENTINRIRLFSDRPIVVREKFSNHPLMLDLKDAHCVVAFSSNTAVDALMEGVPVITMSDCAASRMGRHDPCHVENLFYPDDRMEWAGVLAANQWSLDEIAKGMCWEKIK